MKLLIRHQDEWRRKGWRWVQVPLKLMEKIMVKAVEVVHEGPLWNVSMLQPAEDPEKVHGPWGKMQSVEMPCRSRLLGCGPRRGAHATGCLWPTGDPQWKTAAWTFPAGLYAMGSTHAGEVFGTLSCRRDRWLLLLDLCDNTSQILVWSSTVILKMQTHILKIFIWCSLVFFKKIKIHLVFLSYLHYWRIPKSIFRPKANQN